MRALLIGPYPPPDHGTSIPFKALVAYLGEEEHFDVSVLNTQSGDKHGVSLFSPRTVLPFIRITKQFVSKIHSSDVCIVYGSQRFIAAAGSLFVAFGKIFLRKRIIVYIQGGAFDIYYNNLRGCAKFVVRNALRRADCLLVQTKLVHEMLHRAFPNLAVLPNWTTDLPLPDSSPRILNRADQTFRYLYVGEIRKEKGIVELLKAFSVAICVLKKLNIHISLDLYGPIRTDFEPEFRQLLCKSVRVVHHGYRDHKSLMKSYSTYDCLILPTYFPSEGYPGVILEAMNFGLPIITTRWRAIPEIIVHEATGLLCEPGDIESLVLAIIQMSTDTSLRDRMALAAKEIARKYSAQVVLKKFASICTGCSIAELKGFDTPKSQNERVN